MFSKVIGVAALCIVFSLKLQALGNEGSYCAYLSSPDAGIDVFEEYLEKLEEIGPRLYNEKKLLQAYASYIKGTKGRAGGIPELLTRCQKYGLHNRCNVYARYVECEAADPDEIERMLNEVREIDNWIPYGGPMDVCSAYFRNPAAKPEEIAKNFAKVRSLKGCFEQECKIRFYAAYMKSIHAKVEVVAGMLDEVRKTLAGSEHEARFYEDYFASPHAKSEEVVKIFEAARNLKCLSSAWRQSYIYAAFMTSVCASEKQVDKRIKEVVENDWRLTNKSDVYSAYVRSRYARSEQVKKIRADLGDNYSEVCDFYRSCVESPYVDHEYAEFFIKVMLHKKRCSIVDTYTLFRSYLCSKKFNATFINETLSDVDAYINYSFMGFYFAYVAVLSGLDGMQNSFIKDIVIPESIKRELKNIGNTYSGFQDYLHWMIDHYPYDAVCLKQQLELQSRPHQTKAAIRSRVRPYKA